MKWQRITEEINLICNVCAEPIKAGDKLYGNVTIHFECRNALLCVATRAAEQTIAKWGITDWTVSIDDSLLCAVGEQQSVATANSGSLAGK